MAKNDDDLLKRYAGETRGMPPNLAKIAARNLAREDAQIGKLNVVHAKVERERYAREDPQGYAQSEMDRAAAIGSRYGFDNSGTRLKGQTQGGETGYYAGAKYLGPLGGAMPKGATGIVGSAAASPPTTDPATARQIGFSGAPAAILAKPGAQRTPYERSFLSGYDVPGVVQPGSPGLGFQAGSFLRQAGSFLGRVGRGGLGGLTSPFFPAVRSFLDQFSSRPRPYSPQPVPITGAHPSPSPTPGPRTASNNPYYDFNP